MVTIEENVKVGKVGNSLRIAIPAVFSRAPGILERDTVHLGEHAPRDPTAEVRAKKKRGQQLLQAPGPTRLTC